MNNSRLLIWFLLLGIIGCSYNRSTMKYDYTYLYQEEQKLIKPKFKVFHHSKDSSTLYFELESNNILYGKLEGDSALTARILCKYKVFGEEGKDNIVDSATVPLLNYGENESDATLQSSVQIAAPFGKKYTLEVRFRDQYRDLNVVYYLWIDKRENGNQQFYLLKDENKVITDHILKRKGNYILHKSEILPDGLYKEYQSEVEFSMVPPPFATNVPPLQKIEVDTLFNQIFTGDSIDLISFKQVNKVVFTGDSSLLPFYFYYFYEGFPKITTYEQMIGPIRYISTSSEYKRLQEAINLKQEMDNFWLKLGKDQSRAQKMISEYYRRVELANRRFSTFREGWKTDRGIIFIVYGEPTTIYKTINNETWIYGEENNILSIKFQFNLVDNPMSNNDYQLVRDSDWKNNWYRAVDNWRQAKIY